MARWRGLVTLGRTCGALAAHHTINASDAHQPRHPIAAPAVTCTFGGVPQLAHAVDATVGHPQVEQGVGVVGVVKIGRRHRTLLLGGVVGGRGDLHAGLLGQHTTDRVDPEPFAVRVDVLDDHRSRRSTSAAAKNALAVRNISLARRSSRFSRSSSAIRPVLARRPRPVTSVDFGLPDPGPQRLRMHPQLVGYPLNRAPRPRRIPPSLQRHPRCPLPQLLRVLPLCSHPYILSG